VRLLRRFLFDVQEILKLTFTDAQQNIFGNVSFHHFAVILGGGATGVACAIIIFLMAMHATHLSKPREQYK
jgi:hypothetical protein